MLRGFKHLEEMKIGCFSAMENQIHETVNLKHYHHQISADSHKNCYMSAIECFLQDSAIFWEVLRNIDKCMSIFAKIL